MITVLERIKRMDKNEITASRITKAILRRIANIPYKIMWAVPWGFAAANKKKLLTYKDIHKGKRCFILANGPSLNKANFDLLKNEITIGMNRIYLMEKVNGFKPNYLVCIDKKSDLLQFTEEYNNQKAICFYEWDVKHKFNKKGNFIFIKGKFSSKFSKDPIKEPLGSGLSVTYTCIQLAYYMGFTEVYLIGKDHSYNTNQKANTLVKSTEDENNHFIKGYHVKGQYFGAPDYATEEFAYSLARSEFERNGRIIKDATEGGKLTVFEKVNFDSLFNL